MVSRKSIKTYAIAFALMFSGMNVMAQKDEKAKEILNEVSAYYESNHGVEISFGGTANGKIILKGNMFMLDCDGIKTWFDGVTQWSYVEDTNEVNISSPTEEEQKMVNPYSLIRMYENGYGYKYMGIKKRNGEECKEVMLIPETEQNYKHILIDINSRLEPVYIEFIYHDDYTENIIVKKYTENNNLTEDDFRFDMDAHSDAEIIDLR